MGKVQAGHSNHRDTASQGQFSREASSLARAFSLWRAILPLKMTRAPLCERCQSWEGGTEGWALVSSALISGLKTILDPRSWPLHSRGCARQLQNTGVSAWPKRVVKNANPWPQTSRDLGWEPLGQQHREKLRSVPGVRLLRCGRGEPRGPDDGKGLTGTVP